MKKLNSLQGLRGLGAIMILLFHLNGTLQTYHNYSFAQGVFKYSFSAVDLFFLLSGFVTIYAHSKFIGDTSAGKGYIIDRVKRIYPIYWIVSIPMYIVYFLIPSFGNETIRNFGNIIQSFLLIPSENSEIYPLAVAWSLTYELLFYLLFLILIIFKRDISYPIIGGIIIGSIINFILGGSDIFIIQFIFNAYNLEFIAGMIIAYIIKNKNLDNQKLNYILLSTGIFLVLLSMMNDYYGIINLHRIIKYGIPSAFLVFGLANIELSNGIWIPKFFVKLGDYSFSIFVIHYPVLSLLNKVFISLNIYTILGMFFSTVIIILITLISSMLFYHFIERKINMILFNKKKFNYVKSNLSN